MNIYDIAELAGVSIATVSRVVNDSPLVSDKTKARVRKVMEENNYVPNVFARGLGLGTMKTIGIVCPDVSDAYMAKAVAYLEKNFREYGYDSILQCSGREYEDMRAAVANILNKKIDALFLIGSCYCVDGGDTAAADYVREAAKQVPVFVINGSISGDNIYCALCDDRETTAQAVRELIREGRRNILFLHHSDTFSARQKRSGYLSALAEAGIPENDNLLFHAREDIESVKQDLLAQCPPEVDGIFATNDRLAVGALKFARETGIRVPEELSIIGYDDSELAICCQPELTSIDSMGETLCRTSIDSMLRLLRGRKASPITYTKGTLRRRGTTRF